MVRLFAFHDETFCLAVSFSGPEQRFQRGPILTHSPRANASYATQASRLENARAVAAIAESKVRGGSGRGYVAKVTFTQENMRPPDRRAADRRVVDARERSHWLVGVKWRLSRVEIAK